MVCDPSLRDYLPPSCAGRSGDDNGCWVAWNGTRRPVRASALSQQRPLPSGAGRTGEGGGEGRSVSGKHLRDAILQARAPGGETRRGKQTGHLGDTAQGTAARTRALRGAWSPGAVGAVLLRWCGLRMMAAALAVAVVVQRVRLVVRVRTGCAGCRRSGVEVRGAGIRIGGQECHQADAGNQSQPLAAHDHCEPRNGERCFTVLLSATSGNGIHVSFRLPAARPIGRGRGRAVYDLRKRPPLATVAPPRTRPAS